MYVDVFESHERRIPETRRLRGGVGALLRSLGTESVAVRSLQILETLEDRFQDADESENPEHQTHNSAHGRAESPDSPRPLGKVAVQPPHTPRDESCGN